MRPLRALLLTDSDVFAGTERHILELARGMGEEGVSVSVACPHFSALADHARSEAIPVVEVEKRGQVDVVAARKLANLLSRNELDVIHAHNGRTAFIAALAVQLAGKGRAIATQHFISPARAHRRGPSAFVTRAIHRWVNKRLAHFIAISEAVRDGMISRAEAAEKITVIPNGISDPDRSGLEPPAKIRERHGIAPSVPLIVCVARLEPEKDIATLVRAMAAVRAMRPDAVCLIAGEGSLKEPLTRQIKDTTLQNNVQLVGFIPDTLSLINAADLFVLPSLAEPFGLVLLEAMSLGKPVIATRAGGPIEIVEAGLTGLLVTPKNETELAHGILSLLDDPPALAALGSRGRNRFVERFTKKRMSQATLQVYREMLDGPGLEKMWFS